MSRAISVSDALLKVFLDMNTEVTRLRLTAAYYQLDAIRSLEHHINEGLRAIRDEDRASDRVGVNSRHD